MLATALTLFLCVSAGNSCKSTNNCSQRSGRRPLREEYMYYVGFVNYGATYVAPLP